jgi:hypothetical protein
MDRFYKENNNNEEREYDESFARDPINNGLNDFSDTHFYMPTPYHERTATTNMYQRDENRTQDNFDNFNQWYNNMLNQPQDKKEGNEDGMWGNERENADSYV